MDSYTEEKESGNLRADEPAGQKVWDRRHTHQEKDRWVVI